MSLPYDARDESQAPNRKTAEEILRSAVVLTAVDQSMPDHVQDKGALLSLMRLLEGSSKHGFYIVYWPNGATAIVNGDPADITQWNTILLSTYRQAELGLLGPLKSEGM